MTTLAQAKHIQHRISEHNSTAPITALERSRKLKSLQVTNSKLRGLIHKYKEDIHTATTSLAAAKKDLAIIDKEIEELKSDDQVVVTEHALLRYVERVMKIDLEKVHADIVAMDDRDLVKAGNTIVTVIPDKNDHFNLAQRESQ